MVKNENLILETDFAKDTDFALSTIVSLRRQLLKNSEVNRVNRLVAYPPAAKAKMISALASKSSRKPKPPEEVKMEDINPAEDIVVMKVVKIPPNKRLLVGQHKGEFVRIIINPSRRGFFPKGKDIRCVHEYDDVWRHVK